MKNSLDRINRLDTAETRALWFILKSIRLKHDWNNYWNDLYQRLDPWLIWNMHSKGKVDWNKLCLDILNSYQWLQRHGISIYLFYMHLSMYLSSIYLPTYKLSIYLPLSILSLHLKFYVFHKFEPESILAWTSKLMNLQASSMSFESHNADISWIIFKVYLSSVLKNKPHFLQYKINKLHPISS